MIFHNLIRLLIFTFLFAGCNSTYITVKNAGSTSGGNEVTESYPEALGELETSFNLTGFVEVSWTKGNVWPTPKVTTVQSDGKVVVAGQGASSRSIIIRRLNNDGSIDTTFNSGGDIPGVVSIPAPSNHQYDIRDINIQLISSQEKIIILIGSWDLNTNASGNVLVRLNSDGSLDTSFGTAGSITFSHDLTQEISPVALSIQSDKKILVASSSWLSPNQSIVVSRRLIDGQVDTSFNGTGHYAASFDSGTAVPMDMDVDSSGRIIVVGSGQNYKSIFALRLSSLGTLDTNGFNPPDGFISDIVGNDAGAPAVKIGKGNKIYLAGWADNSNIVAAYDANGEADLSFNQTGKRIFRLNYSTSGEWILSLGLQSDGKLFVVSNPYISERANVALTRLSQDGSTDTSFNSQGSDPGTYTSNYNGNDLFAAKMITTPDNKLYLTGYPVTATQKIVIAKIK
jgi:uncharacterized delta-60 repeat protein